MLLCSFIWSICQVFRGFVSLYCSSACIRTTMTAAKALTGALTAAHNTLIQQETTQAMNKLFTKDKCNHIQIDTNDSANNNNNNVLEHVRYANYTILTSVQFFYFVFFFLFTVFIQHFDICTSQDIECILRMCLLMELHSTSDIIWNLVNSRNNNVYYTGVLSQKVI